MLVGIEASAALATRQTGVGRYVTNMIAGLERLRQTRDDLDVLYFSHRPGSQMGEESAVPADASIYPRYGVPSRLLWMQTSLARSIARAQPSLCHFPNYLAPLVMSIQRPFLLTMYDMSVYRCPRYQPAKTVAVHRALIPILARRASLIVTISESARQDILHYLKVPAEQVRVVYGGVAPQFSRLGLPTAAQVRAQYSLDFPYVLTVGTLEPRKNHANLIDAFGRLVRQEGLPHHLVIAGAQGWKTGGHGAPLRERVIRSGLVGRVHFLGYVPAAALPGLYRGAEAFAFPSLYEGFGLPVVEAFACGVPTLISHDPALAEVAGAAGTGAADREAAALTVDPESVEDIAAGLHCLLTNRAAAARLRAAGLTRAGDFSWDKCAGEHFQLYREVLAGRPTAVQAYCAR